MKLYSSLIAISLLALTCAVPARAQVVNVRVEGGGGVQAEQNEKNDTFNQWYSAVFGGNYKDTTGKISGVASLMARATVISADGKCAAVPMGVLQGQTDSQGHTLGLAGGGFSFETCDEGNGHFQLAAVAGASTFEFTSKPAIPIAGIQMDLGGDMGHAHKVALDMLWLLAAGYNPEAGAVTTYPGYPNMSTTVTPFAFLTEMRVFAGYKFNQNFALGPYVQIDADIGTRNFDAGPNVVFPSSGLEQPVDVRAGAGLRAVATF